MFHAGPANWDRLADIRHLAALRGWHSGNPAGQRDLFLFLSTCFLAWSVCPTDLFGEIYELGKEFCPTWRRAEMYSVTKSAYERAASAFRGEKSTYGGQLVDPRYRFSNQTLIDLLEITSTEECKMRTIISDGTKRERDRLRKEKSRRTSGASTRSEYLSAAASRRQKASSLREQGLRHAEIAEKMGLTKKQVDNLLSYSRGRAT